MGELDESRRKLVSLKMQKDAAIGMFSPSSDAVNGNLSPEKPADRIMGLRELKDSIEEAKVCHGTFFHSYFLILYLIKMYACIMS